MKANISSIAKSPKKLAVLMTICALLGVIWFILVRAVLIDLSGPHFHANFAVYINGEQQSFEEGIYYEEVSSCGTSENDPKTRVHMHDFISDVVHVHDASATWGNFFENIGYTLGNNVLFADANAYVDGSPSADHNLKFILNGQPVQSVANKTINSQDTLLVSFGTENQSVLDERFQKIEQTADEYNRTADPSACSGSQSSGFWDRIKFVIGVE